MAAAAPQIIQFLAAPDAEVTKILQDNIDVGFWTIPTTKKTLMLIANTNQQSVSISLAGAASVAVEILNSGANLEIDHSLGTTVLTLNAISVAGYIFEENSIKLSIL